MNEFIERNRVFFKALAGPLGMVSSILLVLGIMWMGLKSVGVFSRIGNWPALREYWADVPAGIFLFILLGLVGRGMSQLLRYMHDPDYQPGWLLRRGHLLLYAYAVLFTVRACIDFYAFLTSEQVRAHTGWAVLVGALYFLYMVAGDLILVGLGQFVKRLMPVIGEVRTLA